jgi:mannose-6-phosphate isomerase-like protein (cupin superfamily)
MNRTSDEILSDVLSVGNSPSLHTLDERTARQKAVDVWTPAVLLERSEVLRGVATKGTGTAGESLRKFPRHSTAMLFRSSDGGVELHERFADLFYVLDGAATLLTGGTITGNLEVDPGEFRGISIEGGTRQELRSGDVAHVPAGVPHQMLVAAGRSISCFVVKIREAE